jgi:hypothetical protein
MRIVRWLGYGFLYTIGAFCTLVGISGLTAGNNTIRLLVVGIAVLGLAGGSQIGFMLRDDTYPTRRPGAGTNAMAVGAAFLVAAAGVCLAIAVVSTSLSWVVILALGLGVAGYATGRAARDRIRLSGEGGARLAAASRSFGCLLAVAAGLAGLAFTLSVFGPAFVPAA